MTIQQRDYDPALMQGAANTVALPQTITDATNSALAVGPNGATNPVFQVDDSASSAAAGWIVTGTAAGTPPVLQVQSSASNEDGDIKAKGTGVNRVYSQRKIVISGQGATKTLAASDSGSVCLFDRAAGIIYTLPTQKSGLYFDFIVTTAVTTNAYKVITGAGTELLIGGLVSDDTDSSDAVAIFNANGSTHVAITMAGTTTGGLVGTWFRLTCLTSTKWLVNGFVYGSSTVATPFATS
jgi:hypothetical protein